MNAEFFRAVGEILADADAEIAGLKPVCRASGRCCKFEEYGHRLYVTGAELAYFAAAVGGKSGAEEKKILGRAVSLRQFFDGAKAEGCPYQVEGLCTARGARPLGCRVYFCDENAQGWQGALYEKYHGRLRAAHERFGVGYRYVEWREGLRELAEKRGPIAPAVADGGL